MKKILIFLFAATLSISCFGQIPALNDLVRNNVLTPIRTANALDGSKRYTATGTDTYAITVNLGQYTGGLTYASGDMFTVTFTNANTSTTVTLNVDSEGAIAVKDNAGNNPVVGAIKAGSTHKLIYNGTHFRLFGDGGGLSDGDYGDITVSSSGTALTVDNDAITNAKINDVSISKATGTKSQFNTALTDGDFLFSGDVTGWNLDGNTVGSEKFIGTLDAFSFPLRTNNIERFKIDASGNVTGSQTSQSSTNTFWGLTQSAHTGGTPVGFSFTSGAHTGLTQAETSDISFNLNRTVQFANAGAAHTNQRAVYITAPTYSHAAGTTRIISTAATFAVSGPPSNGTATTITSPYTILSETGRVGFLNMGGSSTVGGFTLTDASSTDKVMFDIKKSASVFQVFQEGRTKWTLPSSELISNGQGLFDLSGGLIFNVPNVGESCYVHRYTTSTGTVTGTGTSIVGNVLYNHAFDFGSSGSELRGIYYTPTISGTLSSHFAWKHDAGFVQWNSVLTPSQITSNQNDYNPTGWTNGGAPYGASVLRLSTDASRNITSIAGGVEGRLVIIANVGSNNIVLTDDDGATGTAANRFDFNSNITLLPNQSLLLIYGATSSRWRAATNVTDGQLKGTATNDNATTGNVGEFTESKIASGSAVSLTTATAANVTSISLTAGDWDVVGNINYVASSATITSKVSGASSTSATTPTDGSEVYSAVNQTTLSNTDGSALPSKRFSLSATTTVYLVANCTFSAGSVSAFGTISARRVR